MIYGYARVSTDGQSVDAKVRHLRAAGARQVFRDVASGAKTDRAQLGSEGPSVRKCTVRNVNSDKIPPISA